MNNDEGLKFSTPVEENINDAKSIKVLKDLKKPLR